MERETLVRCVSLTQMTSVLMPASKMLFPCNPEGSQTPMDQVLSEGTSDGPGVLASPTLHSAPRKKLATIRSHMKSLGARKQRLATGWALDLRLPHHHS